MININIDNFRSLRNIKLRECDWVVMSDVTIPPEIKQAWLDYHQGLRDLPRTRRTPKTQFGPLHRLNTHLIILSRYIKCLYTHLQVFWT